MAGLVDLAKKAGFKDNTDDVKDVFMAVKDLCKSGEKVMIKEFGTFQIKTQAARVARNPQTGEKIDVPAKEVLKFKAFDL